MKILIIGSGGREHALAYQFAKDSAVNQIYVAPGNAGTALLEKSVNVNLNEVSEILNFALAEKIDLTMVGSEALLAKGIVDLFKAHQLKIFGPHQDAAKLESSKAFAKKFMQKYNIKTADYQEFTDIKNALNHLEIINYPTVIKADGLAAGKGVIIAENKQQAEQTVKEIMLDKVFGDAGNKIVIEEFLEGVEASILSFTDVKTIIPLLSAKDHKKIGEGETGLNTGGMGVICPNPYVTDSIYQEFIHSILEPTLLGLKSEGLSFSGVIFFGLMMTKKGVYLLEYNMRMGDPETQAVLPLLKTPLLSIINSAFEQKLSTTTIEWYDLKSCCVVLASKGYPQSYQNGFKITGIKQKSSQSNIVFVAGAALENDNIVTSGGRVLNVVGFSKTLDQARKNTYNRVDQIDFHGKTYRKDI